MSDSVYSQMFQPSEGPEEFRQRLEAAKTLQERVQLYRIKLWHLLLGRDATVNGTIVHTFHAAREAGLSHEEMLACLVVELHFANVKLQHEFQNYINRSNSVIRYEKKVTE